MKDPNNKELALQRQTLFMGEKLRGLLLNAWGAKRPDSRS
jgi:hypothetical protein